MENFEQVLTLETLPKAFTLLTIEVREIKRLLQQKTEPLTQADRWFNLNELCLYLPDKPSKATVYGYVHSGNIPFHKGQKKLRFLQSEIDAWLKQGRKKTIAEIAIETDNFLQNKKPR